MRCDLSSSQAGKPKSREAGNYSYQALMWKNQKCMHQLFYWCLVEKSMQISNFVQGKGCTFTYTLTIPFFNYFFPAIGLWLFCSKTQINLTINNKRDIKMPPTSSLSKMLLTTIVRQGIRPACPSCLSRFRLATSTSPAILPLSRTISQQQRHQSTAATKEVDVEMNGGPKFAKLRDRSIMRVAGSDAAELIQGLVANDVNVLNDEKVMYTMFLSSAVSSCILSI